MATPELQWLEMTDFSPGIYSNNNLAGGINVTSDNPCMAQETGTVRCRSLPSGGLGPLPRRKEDFVLADPPGAAHRVAGFATWGQVQDIPITDTNQDHRAEVHLALIWNPSGTEETYGWYRDRIFDTAPSTETIIARNFTGLASSGPTRYAYFFKTRMNPAEPLEPGQPVMCLLWTRNPLDGPDTNRFSRAHPDPADPTTNDTIVIGAETEGYVIGVAHQGRVALGRFLSYNRGVNTVLSTTDNLEWTDVNTNTLNSNIPAQFVPELDQLITDMASMSANQMLVIKSFGGGYVLQGSLGDVTVVQLPNLMCSDGSDSVRGVNTPIGYVYSAGSAGLYVWNGGDASQPISGQLDGDSFTRDIEIQGQNGQMDRWQDLLLAPQNWVYDLNSKGWWRIEDPDDALYLFWSTSKYLSQTYGAVERFDDDEFAYSLFEKDELAYTWTWRSHPLWVTRDQYITVRQGVVALQGHGQVTITLRDSSSEGASESPTVIDIDTDEIQNFRFDINMSAENLIVDIQADGFDAEAPLLHRLFLGYNEMPGHLPNYGNL